MRVMVTRPFKHRGEIIPPLRLLEIPDSMLAKMTAFVIPVTESEYYAALSEWESYAWLDEQPIEVIEEHYPKVQAALERVRLLYREVICGDHPD